MATGWSRSDGWRSYEDWKRWYLLRSNGQLLRDPDRWTRAAVVLQVSMEAGHRPSLLWGEGGAPPTAPRRSGRELVALALEDLNW